MTTPELPDLLADLTPELLAQEIDFLIEQGYIRREIDETLSVTDRGEEMLNEINLD